MSAGARHRTQDIRQRTEDRRRKTLIFGFWSVVFGLVLAGCAEMEGFKAAEQMCIERTATETEEQLKMQVMGTAEEVLGEMHFSISKLDRQRGYIRTLPLAGGQWFEFWRSDNAGGFNAAEANLHSIRRTVELNINRQDERLCIDCEVSVERLSMPEYEVTSSSQAYAMFSASDPTMQRLRLHPEQKREMAWMELGRDGMLEAEILRRIERKIKN